MAAVAVPTPSVAGVTKPAGDSSYFQDKRGEINDLKNLLRDIHVERDPRKKREVVRKVIAFDTLGYDCSKLFSEMVIATSTNDIVVKKMAYQYLSHYARGNEELATLCVNTMTKDCKDADPMVRGLAIRSLSSLRLKSTVEYLVPLLVAALDDNAGYVRRNAAVAVLKLYHLQPDMLVGEDATIPFVQKLKQMMLTDRDPTVVSAAIQTLDEIFRTDGGLSCDSTLFRILLQRSQEFNEWGLCTVLNLLSRYEPQDSSDMFEAMNVLDPCLRQTNSAVVLSCTKIFVKYAEQVPDIKTQVYLRLKEPLLTLMSASTMEIKYCTLAHLELFIQESSIVFEDSFKSFFLKFDEPLQVKKIKLRLLPLVANLDNYQEILQELAEYSLDLNLNLSRAAINAVARVALQIGGSGGGGVVVDQVLLKLLEFLESLDDRVRGDVLDAFKDVLQEFPDRSALVVPALPRFILKEVRGSAIWMMGEFGAQLETSPYLLERLVDRVDELDSVVRCELLTALMKLFFKERALEVRPALERLLQNMLTDVSDVDSHDRAMFYFRLLKQDLFRAGEVVTNTLSQASSNGLRAAFAIGGGESRPAEFFAELNTLSVIYGKHAGQFVDEAHSFPERASASAMTEIPSLSSGFSPVTALPPKPAATSVQVGDDLLMMGRNSPATAFPTDMFGMTDSRPPAAVPAMMTFVEQFDLDQAQFQQIWMVEAPTPKAVVAQDKFMPVSTSDLEDRLLRKNIKCMASGGSADTQFKFYFYALSASTQVPFLAEVVISNQLRSVSITVKTPVDSREANRFGEQLMDMI